jgi:hypothetical protein
MLADRALDLAVHVGHGGERLWRFEGGETGWAVIASPPDP